MCKELWKFKHAPHPDRYCLPYFMPCSDLLNTHLRPGFRHPLASRPPLLRAIIGRGGNPLGLRIDLNAGLGALG